MRGGRQIDPTWKVKSDKWAAGHFVAWDGEGVTPKPDAPQDYVLLANLDAKTGIYGELAREDGISTVLGFTVLTRALHEMGHDATHVCFGMSYDANQLLKDATRVELRALWEGQKVVLFRRFKVAYRPRKSLWVKDLSTGYSGTLWDVFGFFQSTFVKAVENNLGPKDPRLPLIRQGKKARSTFSLKDLPTIRPYTRAELSCLVDLCVQLRSAFVSAGLKLRRWDGAGAAAAALMERERVKDHLATVPDEVHDASLRSYSGGRIETPRYGYYVGKVYHGDVRSAYPFAASTMPSLARGFWRVVDGVGTCPFAVSLVEWDYRRLGHDWPLLPFKFRSKASAIYYPREGTSWVWRPEVESALKVDALARRTKVVRTWEFVPDDPTFRPFAWIADVYKERQRLKRARNDAQKALKLSSNSIYGKWAQHVGGHYKDDGTFVPPPFHQLEYAGYITSVTRARLFDAAVPIRKHVVTLATDGIYATAPLGLVDSDELGGWELSTHEAMLIAQSGVYWLRDERRDPKGCDACGGPVDKAPMGCVVCVSPTCGWTNLTRHYRGFDEDTLDPDMVLDAWRAHRTQVEAQSTRFVTLGAASLTDERFTSWRKWVTEARILEVHATGKRTDRIHPSKHAWRPDLGLVDTDPTRVLGEHESQPYSLKWAKDADGDASDAQEQTSL